MDEFCARDRASRSRDARGYGFAHDEACSRWTRGQVEAQRMLTEKGFALAEAVNTLAVGGSMAKVVRRYRSHVRANKRRLSR